MPNTTISFDISNEILASLNEDAGELSAQMRLFAALQLFRSRKLSFGKAAELAGLGRGAFLSELNLHQIDLINYRDTDLEAELKRFQP